MKKCSGESPFSGRKQKRKDKHEFISHLVRKFGDQFVTDYCEQMAPVRFSFSPSSNNPNNIQLDHYQH
jgi:hypothetical protein